MLIAGAVGGYVVRGTQTATVVQVQTVAPPPPATHSLTAHIGETGGGCMVADLSADTFILRRPGNGLTEGDVVGVAEDKTPVESGCALQVTFLVSADTGFFVVTDETKSVHWGPYDSRTLEAHGWAMNLTYTSGE